MEKTEKVFGGYRFLLRCAWYRSTIVKKKYQKNRQAGGVTKEGVGGLGDLQGVGMVRGGQMLIFRERKKVSQVEGPGVSGGRERRKSKRGFNAKEKTLPTEDGGRGMLCSLPEGGGDWFVVGS